MSWSTKITVPTRAGWNHLNLQKQDVTHAAHLPARDDKQEAGGSRQTSIGIHRTITITNGNYAFNDRVICTTRWMKSKGRGRRAAGRLASEYTGQEQVATRTKQDALNDTAICATRWMKVKGRGRHLMVWWSAEEVKAGAGRGTIPNSSDNNKRKLTCV